jgi:DNA invertase Pin-like site-specific DNA recombinase
MSIGYARVSTADQDMQLQLDALNRAGCSRIFTDTVSGARMARPGLDQALTYLRPGDTLTVWKLDRLGRSVAGLIDLAQQLEGRGVHLCSLTEGIDTTTTAGRLLFHLLAALAQMERDLISERTRAGLAAARAKGRTGGRPAALSAKKLRSAQSLFAAGATVATVAAQLGVSARTLYRRLPESARQVDLVASLTPIR